MHIIILEVISIINKLFNVVKIMFLMYLVFTYIYSLYEFAYITNSDWTLIGLLFISIVVTPIITVFIIIDIVLFIFKKASCYTVLFTLFLIIMWISGFVINIYI